MKDKDSLILENLYDLIVEDAQSSMNQAINKLVEFKVGREVFKYKNKPENKQLIDSTRNEVMPIINDFIQLIKQVKPQDKNLSDLPELVKFYIQRPSEIEQLKDHYGRYVKFPSLLQANTLKSAANYNQWRDNIHKEESKSETKEYSSTLGGEDDPNKVYEDDKIIVFNATDPNSIEKSVANCSKYGKGTTLCISSGDNENRTNYYKDYRFGTDNDAREFATTYFVWLKNNQRYILIDALYPKFNNMETIKMNNNYYPFFSYNNIRDNTDIRAIDKDVVGKFPELKQAFDKKIFKPIFLSPYEEKVKKFHEAIEIGDLETDEERLQYANEKQLSVVDFNTLKNLPDSILEEILRINLTKFPNNPADFPDNIIKKFPEVYKQYIKNRKNYLISRIRFVKKDVAESKFIGGRISINELDKKLLEDDDQIKLEYQSYMKEILNVILGKEYSTDADLIRDLRKQLDWDKDNFFGNMIINDKNFFNKVKKIIVKDNKRVETNIKKGLNAEGYWEGNLGDNQNTSSYRLNPLFLPDLKDIKIDGNVNFCSLRLLSLEGSPQIVKGNFDCFGNNLQDLKGAPIRVEGDFNCNNMNLKSLKGSPKFVSGKFSCSNNELTSLIGITQDLGTRPVVYADGNKLTSLKGLPMNIEFNTIYVNNNELTDLVGCPNNVIVLHCENNKLTSLKGCPQDVNILNVAFNKLTSLKGCSQTIYGNFYCDNNELTDLMGGPAIVSGEYVCNNNKLTSLDGAPKTVKKFKCSHNELTNLKGSLKSIGVAFYAQNNKITSLEGLPENDSIMEDPSYGVDNVGNIYALANNPITFTPEMIYKHLMRMGNNIKESFKSFFNKY
jgi:hypothetical protein